jgi:hypothetical protein
LGSLYAGQLCIDRRWRPASVVPLAAAQLLQGAQATHAQPYRGSSTSASPPGPALPAAAAAPPLGCRPPAPPGPLPPAAACPRPAAAARELACQSRPAAGAAAARWRRQPKRHCWRRQRRRPGLRGCTRTRRAVMRHRLMALLALGAGHGTHGCTTHLRRRRPWGW